MNNNTNMPPKAHKGILDDLFEQRKALLREYNVACSAPVKDNQLIDSLHQDLDKKTIDIDMLLRMYNYDPVMPRFELVMPEQQRAKHLAQLPEVKAAFASDVLAMTDGRWLHLVKLLSPGGELAKCITSEPMQINTYLLVQALCDEGWTCGLTPSKAQVLGKALSCLTSSNSDKLTERITKGKNSYRKYGMSNPQGKQTEQYILQKLRTP